MQYAFTWLTLTSDKRTEGHDNIYKQTEYNLCIKRKEEVVILLQVVFIYSEFQQLQEISSRLGLFVFMLSKQTKQSSVFILKICVKILFLNISYAIINKNMLLKHCIDW